MAPWRSNADAVEGPAESLTVAGKLLLYVTVLY